MERCELTPARREEVAPVMDLIREGRAFQRQQGFVQWDDAHPSQMAVEEDIRRGAGYALRVDGALAGYLCLSFEGDPAYEEIVGAWRYKGDYGVIHRMVIGDGFRGKGLTGTVFRLAAQIAAARGVQILRIDTHAENLRMRHVLEKHGFACCGDVIQNGGHRLAFDKKV